MTCTQEQVPRRRKHRLVGESPIDNGKEFLALFFGIDRVSIEGLAGLKIGKDAGRILMEMQECLRLAIKDAELLFFQSLPAPDLTQQIRKPLKRLLIRVLHGVARMRFDGAMISVPIKNDDRVSEPSARACRGVI
jgi:hypothetical protein